MYNSDIVLENLNSRNKTDGDPRRTFVACYVQTIFGDAITLIFKLHPHNIFYQSKTPEARNRLYVL